MRLPIAAAIAMLVSVATPVRASEPPHSAAYTQCMRRAGGVTAAMIECIGNEYRHFDARLNAAYRIAHRQRPDRSKALTSAQRTWLAYKTANCAYYLDPDGGSLARIAANDCAMRMTAERAIELEAIVKNGVR